jgi:aminopeptidase N
VTGAPGVGDPYFPELGNGGYDVEHYDLVLAYDPASGRIDGTTTITAKTTEPLLSFDLDLVGLTVSTATVDGAPATVARSGNELDLTPAQPLADHATFKTVVKYSGVPQAIESPSLGHVGWSTGPSGVWTINEPDGARSWYPVNDHPSDKATYSFEVTVPNGLQVVANGLPHGDPTPGPTTTTFRFETEHPLASYLSTVAIGHFTFETATGPDGLPIRNAFPPDQAAQLHDTFAKTPDMIAYLSSRFGPYPFESYGALVIDEHLGLALEDQTMSLFGVDMVASPRAESVAVHELAHQWFGDTVTPAQWKDVWLNEGFATYCEWLWREHTGGATAEATARALAQGIGGGLASPPPGDPGAGDLFAGSVYIRGGLTLEALRLTVGDTTFFRIMREWVAQHRDGNASTADFIALSEKLSGRDLGTLFTAWLEGPKVPPLPS